MEFSFRKVTIPDIKIVYRLLVANRPYVGLNSRYTYFLLAKDFSDSCVVVEHDGQVIGFTSGYLLPSDPEVLFNWESVIDDRFRGHGLQRRLFLHQLDMTGACYFEATVNPSNEVTKANLGKLATMLDATIEQQLLFSEADFDGDEHEAEVLFRIGPISRPALARRLAVA